MKSSERALLVMVCIAILVIEIQFNGLARDYSKQTDALLYLDSRISSIEETTHEARVDVYHHYIVEYENINDIQESMAPTNETPIPEDCPYSDEIKQVCEKYDFVDNLPLLIYSMMKVESEFNPNVTSSAGCIGVMQVSPYWQADRAAKLGVTDLWDPYSNVLVATDLLEDLYFNYAKEDIVLAVMMYNMNFTRAKTMYYNGNWSKYAIDVFGIFDNLQKVAA